MERNTLKKKAVVFAIASVFILIALAPAISSTDNTNGNNQPNILRNNQPILSPEEIELKQRELYRSVDLVTGWYWKPSYPNYAPSGMPDFDQKQDHMESNRTRS